jgi:hypothetical protein
VATSEPVVLHHARRGGRCRSRRAAAVCFYACWAALITKHLKRTLACFLGRSASWCELGDAVFGDALDRAHGPTPPGAGRGHGSRSSGPMIS